MSDHISQQSREEIEAKNAPLIQEQAMHNLVDKYQPELMQQFQMQNEKEIAALIAQRTEEMVAEEQEYLEDNQADPLLELKKRDLDIQEVRNTKKSF